MKVRNYHNLGALIPQNISTQTICGLPYTLCDARSVFTLEGERWMASCTFLCISQKKIGSIKEKRVGRPNVCFKFSASLLKCSNNSAAAPCPGQMYTHLAPLDVFLTARVPILCLHFSISDNDDDDVSDAFSLLSFLLQICIN